MIDVFFKLTSDELTSHRKHNHKIILKENQKLRHSFFRKMNFQKRSFVKNYFKKNLKKRFLIVNHTSYFSSILLIKNFNDELRFCVNYRKLNQMIKMNRYFISLITKIFTQLSHAKIFFNINICQIFHKLRMKKNFENLIIFITKFDVYK